MGGGGEDVIYKDMINAKINNNRTCEHEVWRINE